MAECRVEEGDKKVRRKKMRWGGTRRGGVEKQ